MARGLRHRFTRHRHPAYALGVIEAGVGGNQCNGITYYNPPGSIVAMNPGQAHTGVFPRISVFSLRKPLWELRMTLGAGKEDPLARTHKIAIFMDGSMAPGIRHP
jgi:hypothetical protein